MAGDSARRDKDGYYWIMGRIDDVLNVAGHRLGTMEIESALVAHPRVAEAAVVSKPHDIKGESVFAYVVLNVPRPQGGAAKSLIEELRGWVGEQLSPIAKPDEIRLTDNLPKTRSGKIMRRLLRSIARGEEITQDMSTLENPGILEQLRGEDAEAPAAAGRKAVRVKRGAAEKARARPAAARSKVKPAAARDKTKRVAAGAQRVKQPKKTKTGKARKTAKVAAGKAKKTRVAAKRGKQSARTKAVTRKMVKSKSRRAMVKAVRGKPRGKK